MTREEAEALAKSLWGPQGWADECAGFIWRFGVGVGERTFGTGESYDEAFIRAKAAMQRERACPSVARLLA